MRKFLVLSLGICVLSLSACNHYSFSPGHDPSDPMKVAVTSPKSSVVAGGTLQLTATVTGDGPATVEWSVNGIVGGNSTFGTVSATGLFTAPTAVAADLPVAVTATSLANTSVSATVAILVEAPTITSVAVVCNPTSILTTGTSSCSASVKGTGNYNPAVTWSATGGAITSAGVFTPSVAGNATITATSTQDKTRSGSATVSVAVPITITSVAAVCNPASILTNGTTTCSATVQGTGAYNPAVTWTATGGAITSGGVFTPSGAGNATITATSVQDTSKSGFSAVSVAIPITITSVTVVCNPASILTSGKTTCSATVQGTGVYNQAVTWSATGGTITSVGVFTPSAAGNATITATSIQDITRSGSATVSVAVPITITSVAVVCNPASIVTSGTSTCSATVQGTGYYTSAVSWSATGGAITSAGVFTPSGSGTATITATSVQDSTMFGATSVTVNPAPVITGVTMSCSLLVVPVGQTSQCTALVQGTGTFTQNVVWEVNGIEGGDSSTGTISASGLYQAPATAPNPYVVVITATSDVDATKSVYVSIRVQGPISSSTQTIGSAGGTITLADGNSVTIPAGVLQTDTAVSLSSSSVAIQPTNTLFQGIGPSLSLSLNPPPSATGLVQRQHSLLSRAKSLDSSSSSSSALIFIVNGAPESSAAQIQGAFGVADVNNGMDTFYSLPSTYNSETNQTSLTLDPNLVIAGSTLQLGLADFYQGETFQSGGATLQSWDKVQGKFVDVSSGTCPAGGKTLLMMHGMRSDPNGAFNPTAKPNTSGDMPAANAVDESAILNYDSILAIKYDWTRHIDDSALSVANILNSVIGSTSPSCPAVNTIDIEAHSEGVVVSMASMQSGYLSSDVLSKLRHFIAVAGPIDGTPLADNTDALVSYLLNGDNSYGDPLGVVLTFLAENVAFPFIGDLAQHSPVTIAAKSAAAQQAPSTLFYTVVGNSESYDACPWGHAFAVFAGMDGVPNDGVVPVSSANPNDTSILHLQEIGQYSYCHTALVNNSKVVPAVLDALNGILPNPSYALNATTSTFNVTAGSGNDFQLTATSTGGFSGTVTISPFSTSGISGSCSPASVSVSSGTPGTTSCSFTTSSGMSAGQYTLTIQSVSVPLNPITTNITVTVSAQSAQPSYTAAMGDSGKSIAAGSSAQFSLTATSVNGFSNTVSLPQASMNISGASSYWSPSSISISPSSQGVSTLTVTTSAGTPAGTYSIVEYMPNGQSPSVSLTVTSGSSGGGQAPAATTGSASPSTNNATLYGTVNPNGSDTHFYFEYGTSSSNLNNQTGALDLGAGTSAQGISANTGSLNPGTQYYFRLVAYNSYGTTMGSILPFSTTSAQTGPTANFTMTGQGQTVGAPGTLPLTVTTGGSVSVNLANTSTQGSSDISSYVWKFNGTQQCSNSQTCSISIQGSGSGTFTLTVTDSNGLQSTATGYVYLTVSNPTPTVNLIVTGTTCHGSAPGSVPEIDLSFTVSGGTMSSFDIYRNSVLSYPDNYGTTSYQNYGTPGNRLTPGQTYSYYFVVHLAAGGTAKSNTVYATAPTNCH